MVVSATRVFLCWILVFAQFTAMTQLTLDSVQSAARQHYPLTGQSDLLKATEQINIQNLSRAYWPQLSINGQASYQSDVTHVQIPLPNIKIPALSKDQYRLTADLNQLVYDGGAISISKTLQSRQAALSEAELQSQLHLLEDRVNQIYIGILLVDEQLKQNSVIARDLNTAEKRIKAQVDNGTAFRSSHDAIRAELVRNRQQELELRSNRLALLRMLELLTGSAIDTTLKFERPQPGEPQNYKSIKRAELEVFNQRSQLVASQYDLHNAQLKPRTSVFLQGGYGRPGLNMLQDNFDWFYVGGIRLNWNLYAFYTHKNERKLSAIRQQSINAERNTFIQQLNAQAIEQLESANKFREMLALDDEVISLRNSVSKAALAQMENGVITVSDYIRELTAEDLARQQKILHELQLLQAQLQYKTLTGN